MVARGSFRPIPIGQGQIARRQGGAVGIGVAEEIFKVIQEGAMPGPNQLGIVFTRPNADVAVNANLPSVPGWVVRICSGPILDDLERVLQNVQLVWCKAIDVFTDSCETARGYTIAVVKRLNPTIPGNCALYSGDIEKGRITNFAKDFLAVGIESDRAMQ